MKVKGYEGREEGRKAEWNGRTNKDVKKRRTNDILHVFVVWKQEEVDFLGVSVWFLWNSDHVVYRGTRGQLWAVRDSSAVRTNREKI